MGRNVNRKNVEEHPKQLVDSCAADRLGKIYQQDEIYRKRLKEENIIYEKLRDELYDRQAAELENYFVAANATAARKEILTYMQGMRDLLALLKAFP